MKMPNSKGFGGDSGDENKNNNNQSKATAKETIKNIKGDVKRIANYGIKTIKLIFKTMVYGFPWNILIILLIWIIAASVSVFGPNEFALTCGKTTGAPVIDSKASDEDRDKAVMQYIMAEQNSKARSGALMAYEYARNKTKLNFDYTEGVEMSEYMAGNVPNSESEDNEVLKDPPNLPPNAKVGAFQYTGDMLKKYLEYTWKKKVPMNSSEAQLGFLMKEFGEGKTLKDFGIEMTPQESKEYRDHINEMKKKYGMVTGGCKPMGTGKKSKGSGGSYDTSSLRALIMSLATEDVVYTNGDASCAKCTDEKHINYKEIKDEIMPKSEFYACCATFVNTALAATIDKSFATGNTDHVSSTRQHADELGWEKVHGGEPDGIVVCVKGEEHTYFYLGDNTWAEASLKDYLPAIKKGSSFADRQAADNSDCWLVQPGDPIKS